MIIRAKFPSTCSTCGEAIRAGEEIEWKKGSPVSHASCASGGRSAKRSTKTRTSARRSTPPSAPKSTFPSTPPVAGAQQITSRRTGRSDVRFEEGMVIHPVKVDGGGGPDGHYFVVLATRLVPPCEDNQQFDWREITWVRPASDDEAKELVGRLAATRALTIVPRYLCELIQAEGTQVPEMQALLKDVAPLAQTRWEWQAPTKTSSAGAVSLADIGLRFERVRVLEDGSVVGHHGGHYDDYRPIAWRVAQPSEMLLSALASLTGADQLLAAVADAAEAAGVKS